MSALAAGATAPARPAGRPAEAPRRHLEIAPSRAQRRARPRIVHAVVVFAGVVGILLAQLGLSIAVADGAYQLSSLRSEARTLDRQNEALSERLESLQSPQFVAANAERLGMVPSGSLPYIDLGSGSIAGAAGAVGGGMLADGNVIGNATLDGVALLDVSTTTPAAGVDPTTAGTANPGAADTATGAGVVASEPGTLPSPTTR